jgi:hypothetical protein
MTSKAGHTFTADSRHVMWASAKFWRDNGGLLWHSLRGYPHTRDLSMSVISERDAAKTLDWLDSFSIPVEGRAAIAKATAGGAV